MIYVVVGPTGVGKTKLSVELAKKLDGEVVNADSMQVYKTLDIATAKIKEEEKEGIVHHLFDIKDPTDDYTVFDYQRDGRSIISDITSRGKNVILVGGTGLYIKALLYDFDFQKEGVRPDYSELSDEEIYKRVLEFDPNTMIHPNNRRRLERFLTKLENDSFPSKEPKPLYDFQIIGLTTDRENLYKRIDRRVDIMVQEGLLEEARELYDKNIRSKAILTGIGYKELFPYFDGSISLEEALDTIKKNSRHYAKRQYTYFKHQLPVTWFETNYEDFDKTVDEVLAFLSNVE